MPVTSPDPLKRLASLFRRLCGRLGLVKSARSPRKQEAFKVLCRRGIPVDVVVDVGVLHGTAELIDNFPDVHHFLFEPVAECADAISQAYAKLDHTLIQKAVGSGDGVASMSILGEAGSLNSSAHVSVGGANADERAIEVVSLDSCVAGFGHLENCLLKVDTDGNEISVLRGAHAFLSKCSIVVVEATQDNMGEVVSFMSENRFNIFDIVEPCYFDDALWQVDIIFIRVDLYAEKFESIVDNEFDQSKYEIFK